MSDDDLKAFKIGDTQRPTVASSASSRKAAPEESPETLSVGFARIERLLEAESPDSISEKLGSILNGLEGFDQGASTPKDKAASKKAIAAVERAADLMDFLFQTKDQLEANA